MTHVNVLAVRLVEEQFGVIVAVVWDATISTNPSPKIMTVGKEFFNCTAGCMRHCICERKKKRDTRGWRSMHLRSAENFIFRRISDAIKLHQRSAEIIRNRREYGLKHHFQQISHAIFVHHRSAERAV